MLARWSCLLLLLAPAAYAGSCYDESELPAVTNLEELRGEVRAYLGGALYDRDGDAFPTMVLEEPEDWVPSTGSRCSTGACGYSAEVKHRTDLCIARLPPITLTEKEARSLVPDWPKGRKPEQRIAACVESDGFLWFGLSFSAGKGVGGVGRYNLATKKVELRRPLLLRQVSSTRLAWDGTRLWIGTESLEGCIGSNLAEGLVRYDWKADRAKTFKGSDDEGPCGFVVHGLVFRTGGLWVATDLGLSRWDRMSDSWEHFEVERTEDGLQASRTTCAGLYLSLLPQVSTTPGATTGYGSARDQLHRALRAFRPSFAAEHLDAPAQ